MLKTNLTTCGVALLLLTHLQTAQAAACDYQTSVTADFASRDQISEYKRASFPDSWGPRPRLYEPPLIPAECDRVTWQRQRIVAVAKKYIGLPYRHHHIPNYDDGKGVGLDCSNFTAWVYNYGLGIKINSDVNIQALSAGRQLAPNEPFQAGDLLFIRTLDDSRISHVVIYLDADHIIDDHASGVKIRQFSGWYKNHLAYGRRIIE